MLKGIRATINVIDKVIADRSIASYIKVSLHILPLMGNIIQKFCTRIMSN
jgi:hypothetical protein